MIPSPLAMVPDNFFSNIMKIAFANPKKLASSKSLFFAFFQKENVEKERYFFFLPADTKRTILQFAKKEFKGEEGEVKSFWLQKGPITKIALFGLGEKEKWNERKKQLIPRFFVQYAKSNKISEFSVPITKVLGTENSDILLLLAYCTKNRGINCFFLSFHFSFSPRPKSAIFVIGPFCSQKDFTSPSSPLNSFLANCRIVLFVSAGKKKK